MASKVFGPYSVAGSMILLKSGNGMKKKALRACGVKLVSNCQKHEKRQNKGQIHPTLYTFCEI